MGGWSTAPPASWIVSGVLATIVLGVEFIDVWPLGDTTCGYDVMTGNDAIQPKLSSCLVPVGSQQPALSYRSVVLDGAFFHLPVTGKDPRADVSVTINVKPYVLSGTILHYTSPLSCHHCLWELRVDLESDGALTVTFYADGMAQAETKTLPTVRVSKDDWNYLAFGYGMHAFDFFLVHDTYGNSTITVPTSFGSGGHAHLYENNRHLHIGANTNGANSFRGEVTCVSIQGGIKQAQYTDVIAMCNGPWNHLPSVPVFTLPALNVLPLYDADQAGYDVMQNRSLRQDASPKDLRAEGMTVAALGYGSLLLDGSEFSTLDLAFPFLPLQSHFTLALVVHVQALGQETLAHARLTAPSTSGVREVIIRLNASHVTALLGDEGSLGCGHVTVSQSGVGGWHVIGVGRKGSSVFVTSGWALGEATHSCSSGASLASDVGLLRLGGSLDDQEGVHGNVACLAFFQGALASGSLLQSVAESTCRTPHAFPTGSKAHAATEMTFSFAKVRTDGQPTASLSAGSQEFKVRSLAACAKECRLTLHCRSFTVSKVKATGRERHCRLFDFFTRDLLEPAEGTSYYCMTLAS